MIILDTNVVSEPLKSNPNPKVMAWLNDQDPKSLYVTAITIAELEFGMSCLPQGARRSKLNSAIERIYEVTFKGRVLPFDISAALYYGNHKSLARRSGLAVSDTDGMIGAIALANRRWPVATRDVSPFLSMRVAVINPWVSADEIEDFPPHPDIG